MEERILEGIQRMYSGLEKRYSIKLTLGEKVRLRDYYLLGKEELNRSKNYMVEVMPAAEAEIRWLLDYGITEDAFNSFGTKNFEEFTEHFRRIRDECILL
jgi:hypothetical protein